MNNDAPAAAPVLGLHHYAYRCRDAEETRAFYEDVLGLALVHVVKEQFVPSTGEQSPFAGHGSEVSNGQLVIETGFSLLDDLYLHQQQPACRDSVRDGDTGTWAIGPAVC
jgi:catechol 2,3-dioxygenase-like lactoylglutathione lyase family enzyme